MSRIRINEQVRVSFDVEIWNEDDSLAARIDAGTPLLITAVYFTPEDPATTHWNVDVKVISHIYSSYTTNIDIAPEDLI